MIARQVHQLVAERLRQFPAVGIVGPRQSGKTTLARQFSSVYFDLEQEADRLRLDLEWGELVKTDRLVVLDEAQSWPEVFPRLRGAIDERRASRGRFLILGSVAPSLMKQVGESLAGRLALVELSPLTLGEVPPDHADALWRYGGFPDGGALDPGPPIYPAWHESYLRQMAHQDLPAWGLSAKPEQTERLLRLVAAMNGSQVNLSQLGRALGVSYHTVQNHLDYLEGAYLLRRLIPYFVRNFPKRLTKTPKLFWRDSGLLHCLMGMSSGASPIHQPWVGASWEGWVIEQILAFRRSTGASFSPYFFRTSDGLECDLLIESGNETEVIEIKLSASPTTADFAKLDKIAKLVGATRQVLISRIADRHVVKTEGRWSMNLAAYLSQFRQGKRPPADIPPPDELTVPTLYHRLREAAGALVDDGTLSETRLARRAEWLRSDLDRIDLPGFRILPTLFVPTPECQIPLVEYQFETKDHDLNRASPDRRSWNVTSMEGSGLNRAELLYLSRVCEIGHSLIPRLWTERNELRKNVRSGTQHLDTLNEIWWLSRWQALDADSVHYEPVVCSEPENLAKRKPPRIDWSFTVLGGQFTLRLSVKNRRGTAASGALGKEVRLFGDSPEIPFGRMPSGESEANVLAITAYHAGAITESEEAALVERYFKELPHPVIDAVAIAAFGNGSYEKMFFPPNAEANLKSLVLKAIFKAPDPEDHSRVGILMHPLDIEV